MAGSGMIENKFFRRIDKYVYDRLWLVKPDGSTMTWEWNGGFWKSAVPDFDLNNASASRPLDVDRLKVEIANRF
jgi:hypothetical protein